MTEDKSELIAPTARLRCAICGRDLSITACWGGTAACYQIGRQRERRRAESAERELESCRSRLSTAEKEREGMRGERDDELLIAQGWEDKYEDAASALEKALGALRAAEIRASYMEAMLRRVRFNVGDYGNFPAQEPLGQLVLAIDLALSGGAHIDGPKAQKEEEK